MVQKTLDPSHFEAHIKAGKDELLALDLLAENTPLSKQKLKSAMSKGCVWLESSIGIHRVRRAKKSVHENDTLHIYYDEIIQDSTPATAELIADEGEYSIWNKPAGMYSQGSKWGDHCTIYRWAERHLKPERPAFPVHRLDRAASGLIILAHTKKTASAFSTLFKDRDITKQYRATVEGSLDTIDMPHPITDNIDDKTAVSKITSREQAENDSTMLTIEIETGRKHQIRKHLAGIGHPIIGDRLYGSKESEKNLQLQSHYLQFKCPVTGKTKEYSL